MISLVIIGTCALAGCGDDAADAADSGAADVDAGSGSGSGLALSADFLHHTLSFVQLGELSEGNTRKDALAGELDLSAYPAGPLSVEITPDRKQALVSLSSGFFGIPGGSFLINAQSVPTDPGVLLFVDLEKREVAGELQTGKGPMGVALSPDGKRAFVAHFTSGDIAVVDVDDRALLERVKVGPYAEEITLDETGAVGILSYSSAGNVVTFAADDVSGTLSDPVELTGDAAGVAFFPGTKIAYLVQAPNPILSAEGGYTILDVSDPQAPEVLEDVRDAAAPAAYPALAVPARKSVVVPIAVSGKHQVQEYKLGKDNQREIVQTIDIGAVSLFGSYSVALHGESRLLLTVPRERKVVVVDLETQESFDVPWDITEAGPTDLSPF